MKIKHPSKKDLSTLRLAIESFDNACGSIDPSGRYTPSLDSRNLWMMIEMEKNTVDVLFDELKVNKAGPKSCYNEVMNAKKLLLSINAFKIRCGLWKSAWIGNVDIIFDEKQVYVGSMSSREQSDMWHHLRNVLNFQATLHSSTEEARLAIGAC